MNGKGGKGCSAVIGYSIPNRTCAIDVRALMLKYGGGGHRVVGICQLPDDTVGERPGELLKDMKRSGD